MHWWLVITYTNQAIGIGNSKWTLGNSHWWLLSCCNWSHDWWQWIHTGGFLLPPIDVCLYSHCRLISVSSQCWLVISIDTRCQCSIEFMQGTCLLPIITGNWFSNKAMHHCRTTWSADRAARTICVVTVITSAAGVLMEELVAFEVSMSIKINNWSFILAWRATCM